MELPRHRDWLHWFGDYIVSRLVIESQIKFNKTPTAFQFVGMKGRDMQFNLQFD